MNRTVKLIIPVLLFGTGCVLLCSFARNGVAQANARHQVKAHLEASATTGTLIGLQYEPYFTPHNVGWETNRDTDIPGLIKGTQEAVPILGKYSSFDVNIIRKHEEWFEYLGIDWLLIDWTNMLWMNPTWEKHEGATHELEQATELLFKTYSQMEKEGKHPPKLVLMLGLQNGDPVPHAAERLNGIVAWTNKELRDNPEYRDQWLYYSGKPLLTIMYNTVHACDDLQIVTRKTPVVTPGWTVRWMASQLQVSHAEKCGMWSWMDGIIRQVVTYHEGKAEETVVTPSCFPIPDGWLDPRTAGRDHGAPYLESWQVAFEARPRFIQIHQWNEFAGQTTGGGPKHNIYGDEYNQELSDDIEPTELHGCSYRGCGGWGYYYMNLTKALISLYRGETPGITVMALSAPFEPATVKGRRLPLKWQIIGSKPASYTLEIDGKTVAGNIREQTYTLDLAHAQPGKHRAKLIANGAGTYFILAPDKLTERSAKRLPVTSTVEFTYAPSEH